MKNKYLMYTLIAIGFLLAINIAYNRGIARAVKATT